MGTVHERSGVLLMTFVVPLAELDDISGLHCHILSVLPSMGHNLGNFIFNMRVHCVKVI